jgi:hypothetical protein
VGLMLARDTDGAGAEPVDAGPKAGGGAIVVKIDGVGEFEALSASFNGKSEIHLTKSTDALSSKLFELAAKGTSIKVEIRFNRGGKAGMTIKIADGIISNISHGGAGGDRPEESLSINGTLEVKQGDGEGASEGAGEGAAAVPH